jgi:mRNA interferase MazF
MKPGELVLVRFPEASLTPGKLRPAMVVAIAPGRYTDVLLALVTSRIYQEVPEFDEVISVADEDFAVTRLKSTSVIRLARLVTVEAEIIEGRLGTISPARLRRVRQRLVEWLRAQ